VDEVASLGINMKVKRQNLSEEYSTTVGWVNDFANNLEKNADYLSNLRSIMKKRNDFDTIEEKMADLKARAGFDLVKNVNTNTEENIKEAGCGGSCSGSCKPCQAKGKKGKDDDVLSTLKSILSYIQDFAEDRPDANYGTVITHCRDHPNLGYDRIEGRLHNGKFKAMIEKLLSKHKKDPEIVEYVSEADMPSSFEDDIADYMSHAQTGS
jgi:hypothetical protein